MAASCGRILPMPAANSPMASRLRPMPTPIRFHGSWAMYGSKMARPKVRLTLSNMIAAKTLQVLLGDAQKPVKRARSSSPCPTPISPAPFGAMLKTSLWNKMAAPRVYQALGVAMRSATPIRIGNGGKALGPTRKAILPCVTRTDRSPSMVAPTMLSTSLVTASGPRKLKAQSCATRRSTPTLLSETLSLLARRTARRA